MIVVVQPVDRFPLERVAWITSACEEELRYLDGRRFEGVACLPLVRPEVGAGFVPHVARLYICPPAGHGEDRAASGALRTADSWSTSLR